MENNPAAFAIIDKNLCNYPLARDTRTQVKWRRSKKTGRYWAHLPGDDRVILYFAANATRRCPNGLDVNVLLYLLGEFRKQGKPAIKLPKLRPIARALGLSGDSDNARRVKEALKLWCEIEVKFTEYYTPAKKQDDGTWLEGHKVSRRFGPPLELGETTIGVDENWVPLNLFLHRTPTHNKYTQRVALPLPMNAASQNVVLTTLVSFENTKARSIRRYCRKIGLNHGTRRRVLNAALREADEHFGKQNGSLIHVIRDQRILLLIGKPKHGVARQGETQTQAGGNSDPRQGVTQTQMGGNS